MLSVPLSMESKRKTSVPSTPNGPFEAGSYPHDVAKAISALASDDFSRTTGTVVPVDSGVAGAFLR